MLHHLADRIAWISRIWDTTAWRLIWRVLRRLQLVHQIQRAMFFRLKIHTAGLATGRKRWRFCTLIIGWLKKWWRLVEWSVHVSVVPSHRQRIVAAAFLRFLHIGTTLKLIWERKVCGLDFGAKVEVVQLTIQIVLSCCVRIIRNITVSWAVDAVRFTDCANLGVVGPRGLSALFIFREVWILVLKVEARALWLKITHGVVRGLFHVGGVGKVSKDVRFV